MRQLLQDCISENMQHASMFRVPTFKVAATGTVQGDAAALLAGFTWVTAADAVKGVKLPVAKAGDMVIIKNDDTANAVLKIYPATGAVINALAANAALSIALRTSVILVASDSLQWFSLPLLAS